MFKKRWVKWLLCLLLVIGLVFVRYVSTSMMSGLFYLLLIATGDDCADKTEIFAFVREHEEDLLLSITEGDYSSFEHSGFIGDIDAGTDVVTFSCGGVGVGSGTAYVGFYYAPNGDMTSLWCAPNSAEMLVPSGEGFVWHQEDGDNTYYTEHICGDFYYYEASF